MENYSQVPLTENQREELRLASLSWRRQAASYLAAAGYGKQAATLEFCSDPQTMSSVIVCSQDESHYSKAVVQSCHLRYCPVCSHARSAELVRNYEPIVLDALTASPDSYRLKHVVLTTPYPLTAKWIGVVYRKIWKQVVATLEDVWGVKARYWKDHDLGIIGSSEFGDDGLKLHIHMLVLSPWIDREKLSRAWSSHTSGQCKIVFVRACNDVSRGLTETLKYATKLTELPPSLVPKLHEVLKGTRRVRAFGVFAWKLAKVQRAPAVCPTCGAALQEKHLQLLNLRLGNNFASPQTPEGTKNPVLKAIPPPEQLKLDLPGLSSEKMRCFNDSTA